MGKPRLIILIRHAQSEGNKNREIHQTIPDHRVKLTQDGRAQALDAGRRLRKLLRADDTLHIFTSPYRRTRETTEGILATLTSDDEKEGGPSPYKRNNIKVYEEPRLREQDFGNFQPCSAEMERMWQERADYGHFFYRIPDGESAADAYDRVSGFNESLWRQFGDDDFASVCVLVTHGLMSRVFLMKWYHWGVEYFEDLRNVNHCEFLIMRKQEDSGKYILENKLRTWSELRRERAQKQKDGESGQTSGKDAAKLDKSLVSSPSIVPLRRWGGCPNGCSHDKDFKIRSDHSDLIKRDGTNVYDDDNKTKKSSSSHSTHTSGQNHSGSLSVRRPAARRFHTTGNGQDETGDPNTPQIDITRAREEIVSSPDGTPSFISVEERIRAQSTSPAAGPRRFLHLGRDFGGTYSGHTSDADSSEDERARGRLARLKMSQGGSPHSSSSSPTAPDGAGALRGYDKIESTNLSITVSAATPISECSAITLGPSASSSSGQPGHKRDPSRMGRRVRANRLGDAPHCSDCEQHGSSDGPDHGEGDDEDEDEDEDEEADPNVATPEGEIDELDDALDLAEAKDRSLMQSVY